MTYSIKNSNNSKSFDKKIPHKKTKINQGGKMVCASETKAMTCLEQVLKMFESGEIPEAIAIASFPTLDIPSSYWSLANRLITLAKGTIDARGFQQWKKAGRKVKKGAKAFHILAPITRKVKSEDPEEEYKLIILGLPRTGSFQSGGHRRRRAGLPEA